MYAGLVNTPHVVIPIGTDFELFQPLPHREELRQKHFILPNSILFIGADSDIKGFRAVQDLIEHTEYNFCLVMKDDFTCTHPRVRVFNRIPHDQLVEIINCCAFLLCTSKMETQHLSGIEAAACGLPILATNVGAYFGLPDGEWGMHYSDPWDLSAMFIQLHKFHPRTYFKLAGFDLDGCRSKWEKVLCES
jgi:glycosyltransferase involved in cell wall biosynthesis